METPIQNNKNITIKRTIIGTMIVVFLLLCAYFVYSIGALFVPVHLSEKVVVEIPEGYSVSETASQLETQGVIRSATAYKVLNKVYSRFVKSGAYEFNEGFHSLLNVRARLHNADYGNVYISVTIPEGSHRREIAQILERSKLEIDSSEFLSLTTELEGYLFPDTYRFLPGTTAKDIVEELSETFAEKTKNISSTRSLSDIITMASIVEKEANSDPQEMAMVAGILWKRIEVGMPLQVDAPFLFSSGKTSAQLTTGDLRADGNYNTYTNKGLTPTPIGNPGLQAITATINPIDSVYFFYLHDNNGGIHYGVTHNDHVNNKNTYLR